MKQALIATMIILSGCGDINVDGKALEGQNEASDGSADEAKPSHDQGSKLADKATVTATASCSATATVSAEPQAGSKRPLLDWNFTPGMKNFNDSVNNAPVGYRLPTRVELIEGVDSGDLVGYTEIVWSSTKSGGRDDHAYSIRLSDGWQIDTWKEGSAQTIYVKEITEQ